MARRQPIVPARSCALALLILVLWATTLPGTSIGEPLVSIEIEGIAPALAERLTAGLSLTPEIAAGPRHPARLARLARQGVTEMETMLAVLGYHRAAVTLEALPQPASGDVRYRVVPGEPLHYRSFDLTLLDPPHEDAALSAAFAAARQVLHPGAVVNQEIYEQQKSRLLELARERGYFGARFTRHEIVVDPQRYAASGRLVFAPGPRSRFGAVEIEQSHLNASLVRRMVRIDPAEPYNSRRMLLQEQRLMDSDYFASAAIAAASPQTPGAAVPLTVVTTPGKRHRYQVGAGVTTDIGPRVSLGWLDRYRNPAGHRLNLEGAAAPVKSSLEAEYRIPIRDPLQDSLLLRGGWAQTDSESRESELLETAVERSVARGPWREGLSLRLLEERFDAGDDAGRSLLLVPGIRWERLWSDRPVTPRRGHRIAIGLHGASEVVLSDADFFQATLSLGYLRSLGQRNRVLLRADLGATATADFDNLPASYRFFAGGDRSLRGFDFETLGPQDDDGDVSGGRYLAVGSLELDRRFGDQWGGALFYDFGGAFNNRQQPVEHAVGIGARLFTPIGTLRLDFATAVSRRGSPWRLHLSVGPDL